MKFIVYRTSTWSRYCPCDGAKYDNNNQWWTIEFYNLDEVMEFCSKYGEVIISPKYNHPYNSIEIYDAYRE
jgi:hypothetical protein